MKHENFAVFVISHGRAKTLTTPDILRKHGYTGLIYIVVDDTDEQVEQYQERFGENVLVFSKSEYMKSSDSLDTKTLPRQIYTPVMQQSILPDRLEPISTLCPMMM